MALKAKKVRGVMFAASQSQFDASEEIDIKQDKVKNIISDLRVSFFYYHGDETLQKGIYEFNSLYRPHIRELDYLVKAAYFKSPAPIWPIHLTPMGIKGNSEPVIRALEYILDPYRPSN